MKFQLQWVQADHASIMAPLCLPAPLVTPSHPVLQPRILDLPHLGGTAGPLGPTGPLQSAFWPPTHSAASPPCSAGLPCWGFPGPTTTHRGKSLLPHSGEDAEAQEGDSPGSQPPPAKLTAPMLSSVAPRPPHSSHTARSSLASSETEITLSARHSHFHLACLPLPRTFSELLLSQWCMD